MVFCRNCSSRIDDGVLTCPVCKANLNRPKTDNISGIKTKTTSESFDDLGAKSLYTPTSGPSASYKISESDASFDKTVICDSTTPYGAAPSAPTTPVISGAGMPAGKPPVSKRPEPVRPPAYIPTDVPPKSAIDSMNVQEEFARSTCRYTNIVLSVLIVIILFVSGCFAYVRFLAPQEESKYASKAKNLVKDYVDSVNEGDADALMSVIFIDALSDEEIEDAYGVKYFQIKDDLEKVFSQMGKYQISIDDIQVADMSDKQIEKLNSDVPGKTKIRDAVDIECVMHMETEDGKYSEKRNLSAVYADGEWYLYKI